MPLVEILSEQQRKKRVWKRVFNLLIAVSLLLVGFYLYVVERNYQTEKWHDWVHITGERLLNQYTELLSVAINDKDNEAITTLLNSIASQPGIIEVVLFAPDGQAVFNEQWQPAQRLLYDNQALSPQIYIADLVVNNKPQGFLRITLSRKTLMEQLLPVIQANYRPFGFAATLLLIIGFIVGRKFTLWRNRN